MQEKLRRYHTKTSFRFLPLVVVAGVAGFLGLRLLTASNAAPTTQAGLVDLVQNVPNASIYRYNTTDSQGAGMDTAKIIANPAGGYIAVYHWSNTVRVASSTDLKNWTFRANLDSIATQPTIAATSDGGFLVVHEYQYQANQPGHVKFLHYPNLNALYTAKPSRTFLAPRTLTPCSEGTPNIYSASLNPDIARSTIKIGFHYHNNCDTDRDAFGELVNFSSWKASVATTMNNALITAASGTGNTVRGNIGDRDALVYGGTQYSLHEVQYTKGDFGSWRMYLLNYSTNQAQYLAMKTHKGSRAFANPTFTALKGPDGSDGIVVTIFIPHNGAASGEGGELIYFVKSGEAPKPAPAPAPAPKPATTTRATSVGTATGVKTATGATTSKNGSTSTAAGSQPPSSSTGELPQTTSQPEATINVTDQSGTGTPAQAESAKKSKRTFGIGLVIASIVLVAAAALYIIKRRQAAATEDAYGAYDLDEGASTNEYGDPTANTAAESTAADNDASTTPMEDDSSVELQPEATDQPTEAPTAAIPTSSAPPQEAPPITPGTTEFTPEADPDPATTPETPAALTEPIDPLQPEGSDEPEQTNNQQPPSSTK